MSWSNRYIGIPFLEGGRDIHGCDCGGLVLLALREEHGIHAADFRDYEKAHFAGVQGYAHLAAGIEDLMRREWIVVRTPRPFDLVRFRYGRNPCHVGLWVNHSHFLHVVENGGDSHLCRHSDASWRSRFIEFRRHHALMGETHV